jgi:hypothetical protein
VNAISIMEAFMTTHSSQIVDLSAEAAAHALFNRQLETYRKVTRENLMYHREVYDLLREVLVAEAPEGFHFVDVACGDASASTPILKDTPIGHYHGIDLSARSLELARTTVATLPCRTELHCRDFAEAMASWRQPVDVVWVGMSLHHLQPAAKLRFMQDVFRSLRAPRLFLIWEPALLNGENREEWIDRFSLLRPDWAALSDEEFAAMEEHSRLADFPETPEDWLAMGRDAGFAQAEEAFMMPNRMGRVFKYRT